MGGKAPEKTGAVQKASPVQALHSSFAELWFIRNPARAVAIKIKIMIKIKRRR